MPAKPDDDKTAPGAGLFSRKVSAVGLADLELSGRLPLGRVLQGKNEKVNTNPNPPRLENRPCR